MSANCNNIVSTYPYIVLNLFFLQAYVYVNEGLREDGVSHDNKLFVGHV